ncbi:MAG: tetratricopeptide repeat protein [Candidatus Rokuibacteriota bacterium]
MKRRMAMVTALAALLMLGSLVSPVSALEEADRLFMVGEQALAVRFFPVAKRTLDRFVTQYPKDPRAPRAMLLLGQARLALNEPQPALEAFQKAQTFLSTPAELLEVKFWEAEALFRLKRYTEARAAYDAVVRADAASPLAPEALYGYGFSELELKRPEPAITAFRDFISTWPEHALAPAVTLQLARAYVELKRVNDALPLLAGFASKYPNSKMAPDAQFLLGYMKVTTGDPRGGIVDLRAFLASNPNHEQAPTARRLVGQALGKYGDREDLAEAYKSLMEQDPPTAEALSDAAAIAGRLNRTKDQEEAWKKLRAQFPDHALTRRMSLDRAATAFKQKNWKDAAALAQPATQSDDDSVRAEAWLLLGEAELKQRRFPQAVKAFETVGGISDVDTGVRFRALAGLGLAREEQKEWKAALTAYEAVASRSPDSTLRDWARERATAMKNQLPKSGTPTPTPPQKRSEPAKPADKGGAKSKS